MSTILTQAQIEQRRAAGRKGGQTRARQFTSEHQRAARACVRPASLRAAGRKGYAVLAARNPDHAADLAAAYRRAHPSDLEIIVGEWLAELGSNYARDEKIESGLYVDFALSDCRVIECDSTHWHERNTHHNDDRPARDQSKTSRLAALGYRLLRLSESEIRDGSGCARLLAFLQSASQGDPHAR